MTTNLVDTLRFDEQGLVPAIVQDAQTGAVLMLAYVNRESIRRTVETGETHFWSRRRQSLWHKGETSGNIQKVSAIRVDCDADALLVTVEQKGNACHTGEYSCFFTTLDGGTGPAAQFGETLGKLARVIRQRALEKPVGSYTVKLLEEGTDRILKKIGEEAGEVLIAAKNHRKDEISWEVADLLYHTLVLLESEGVQLADVALELEGRSGRRPPPNIY
jgi:phosphoribosyl-ATP pyrophosphohydrolase/phosphoribosyl-AMP cyclohydrolase